MGWVCENCSTNNEDGDEECFVCGAKKPLRPVTPPPAPDPPPAPAPVPRTPRPPSPPAYSYGSAARVPARRRSRIKRLDADGWTSLLTLIFMIAALAAGQALTYVFYIKNDAVFILTRFQKSSGAYGFNVTAFLIVTSCLALLSGIALYIEGRIFIKKVDARYIWLATVPYCLTMLVCPAMTAIIWCVAAIVYLTVKFSGEFKKVAKIALCLTLLVLAAFIGAWGAIGKSTTVIFDFQGGEAEKSRVEARLDEDMPAALAPERQGYIFLGYFDEAVGGKRYYDEGMLSTAKWDREKTTTLYAHWEAAKYNISLNKQGGSGGASLVKVTYDSPMPSASAPTYKGYDFLGYYDSPEGGVRYYDSSMNSARVWDVPQAITLYARWKPCVYRVTFDKQGGVGGTDSVNATYAQAMPAATAPHREGFTFNGYYTGVNGAGSCYYGASMNSARNWGVAENSVLYAYWVSTLSAKPSASGLYDISSSSSVTITVSGGSGDYTYEVINTPKGVLYVLNGNVLQLTKEADDASGTVNIKVTDNVTSATATCSVSYSTTGGGGGGYCVAAGTLITLANGEKVPVESLTGSEELLVWNLFTGGFDSSPIVFIDSEEEMEYEVITLAFSDGATVKIIDEHAFWDCDLNEYVFLRADAAEYIGHTFIKEEGGVCVRVKLTGVTIARESVSAWSPVTYSHLCYFVNGMLSAPGATEGLINIFTVGEGMEYDAYLMRKDIEEYGLYGYEELSAEYAISEQAFEAFNLKYLKISLGKALITKERLDMLFERYIEFIG